MKLKKALSYLKNPGQIPRRIQYARFRSNWGQKLPDDVYIKKMFKMNFGYELDLENPQTFNEKLQWLKLYNRKSEYVSMVDKYEAKKYVADRIGEQYIIPTLGVWDNVDDIDFNSLPEKFVLKTTHDSGGIIVCKNKAELDIENAKTFLRKHLLRKYADLGREWVYKEVKPRVIAEEYMEDSKTAELRDYKFFAFNGAVKAIFIASERQNPNEETKFDFFDCDFNHLPFTNGHPCAKITPQKPEKYDEMVTLAEKLSEGIPHVRVDFYEVDEKIYFGELTFFHWSGMVPFEPAEWDRTFGDWITLPEKTV